MEINAIFNKKWLKTTYLLGVSFILCRLKGIGGLFIGDAEIIFFLLMKLKKMSTIYHVLVSFTYVYEQHAFQVN